MSTPENSAKDSEDFDEEDLIRSEFESIVSALSLDESTPNTYLEDLELRDPDSFIAPNPARQGALSFFHSAKLAVQRWLRPSDRDDDGAAL